jgi:hypothetical protein
MSEDPFPSTKPLADNTSTVANFRDSKPADAANGDDCADVARVEVLCDLIKVDAERLRADLTTIKQISDAAQEDIGKERERVLDLIANQQRLLESEVCKSNLMFDRGEMALAQAVLVAQQRARSQAGRSTLRKRLRALRTAHSQVDRPKTPDEHADALARISHSAGGLRSA